jgi:SAM-dependent methyltransferase
MKLDLGCGTQKRGVDWVGCDSVAFPGVDKVFDLGTDIWPFDDNSVDEAYCSHVLEHLTNHNGRWERVHFFNELSRVLKPEAKCQVIIPYWNSTRYYGDPTHKEPFSEFAWYYLDRGWRRANAPHCDAEQVPGPQSYNCDLGCTWGYNIAEWLLVRHEEFRQFAMQNYKDAITDMLATVQKRPAPKALP